MHHSPDILWCVKVTAAELITAQSLSVEVSSSAHRHSTTTPLRYIEGPEQEVRVHFTLQQNITSHLHILNFK